LLKTTKKLKYSAVFAKSNVRVCAKHVKSILETAKGFAGCYKNRM